MVADKPENSGDFGSLDELQKQVIKLARSIRSTMEVNRSKTKARMNLPDEQQCEREILALAIEELLVKSFSIVVPGKVMTQIKGGKSVKFKNPHKQNLPPLTVIIFLEPGKKQMLQIEGSKPSHGTNGLSVLVFRWKQESGAVDELGNIDLKKINKLPNVKEGDLLAQVYQHTSGLPGISISGKRLHPNAGIPLKVKWDEDSISKVDEPETFGEIPSYKLYAKTGGVVKFSLAQENDPKTLIDIAVSNTVVINGDVDYGVGDQGEIDHPELGCESNIVVEGSVRGVFSIQSNGYIQVKQAIEGTVSATEVETELITGGSSVTAKESISAGSIINANAKAQKITVKENTNDSVLCAAQKLTFEEGATCMSLQAYTKCADLRSSKFSGVSCFILGDDIFKSAEEHIEKMKKIDKKINEYQTPLKEIAENVVDHLAVINSIAQKGPKAVKSELMKDIEQIKAAIVSGFKSVEVSIDDTVVALAQRMQQIFVENDFGESVFRKVELLLKTINRYNDKEMELAPYVREMETHKNDLTDLCKQLHNDLIVQFSNVDLISDSTELKICCGEAKRIFRRGDLPGKNFSVKYAPPEDIEKLREGKLHIHEA